MYPTLGHEAQRLRARVQSAAAYLRTSHGTYHRSLPAASHIVGAIPPTPKLQGRLSEIATRTRTGKGRTSFVSETLYGHLARSGEIHPQHLALQFVEVHVVNGILRIGIRCERYEAKALVLLLCSLVVSRMGQWYTVRHTCLPVWVGGGRWNLDFDNVP